MQRLFIESAVAYCSAATIISRHIKQLIVELLAFVIIPPVITFHRPTPQRCQHATYYNHDSRCSLTLQYPERVSWLNYLFMKFKETGLY